MNNLAIAIDTCRPSGFARDLACPGARRMRMKATVVGGSSHYAREGSAAHDLAARCLQGGTIPVEHYGERITIEGETFTVDADMIKHVSVFTNHCRLLMEKASWFVIEEKLSMPGLEMPSGGTGDFVALVGNTLHVVDLKYGRGIYVVEVGNAQFLCYGYGAMTTMPEAMKPSVEKVHLTVIQPRHEKGDPIRTWEITPDDVQQWLDNVAFPGIAVGNKPDAPLVPGDHCRFCPASGFCTAPLQHMAESMKTMEG